jgi:hypothetical protein
MKSRKAKRLALARKRLRELTPAELTAVSGGWGGPFPGFHHHRHHHRHHHHHHFHFFI